MSTRSAPFATAILLALLAVHGGCDDGSTGAAAGAGGGATAAGASADDAEARRRAAVAAVRAKRAAAPAAREVVCDLDHVKRYQHQGGGVSFDLSVSHTGAHVAVFRSVSFTMNNWMRRVEIDGQRGPTFRTINAGRWSDDGSTYLYAGNDFQGQIPGSHVVHDGKRHGPYDRIEAIAISADGKHWAAFHRAQREGPALLVVDGQPHDLPPDNPPVPETLRFDATAKTFVYKRSTDKITERWFTIDGQQVPAPDTAPDTAPPSALPFPPGVTVKVTKIGKGKEARQQLAVNGTVIGEFDAVLGRADSVVPAYPQPDGTLIVYVVEGNQLVRLRL